MATKYVKKTDETDGRHFNKGNPQNLITYGERTKQMLAAIDGTEETGHLATFTLKCAAIGQGTDHNDVEQMKENFIEYLKLCAEEKMRVGNMSAYLAMGINRKVASHWRTGYSGNEEQKELIDFVDSICASYRESLMADNKLSAPVGIFWQKNFDGMKDIQDVVVDRPNLLGDGQDADAIAAKYQNLPED